MSSGTRISTQPHRRGKLSSAQLLLGCWRCELRSSYWSSKCSCSLKPPLLTWVALTSQAEPNTTCGTTNINEVILNDTLIRLVPCPAAILVCFLWWLMGAGAETHSQQYGESLNWRSLTGPSSELREPHGIGGGKTVGIEGDGGPRRTDPLNPGSRAYMAPKRLKWQARVGKGLHQAFCVYAMAIH